MTPPGLLARLLAPERRFAVLRVVVIAATVATAARGYREPHTYPISHWLLDWRHGLIKRGFVGTLVSPLFAWKSPSEIQDVVTTLSLLVLVGALVALVACALCVARAAKRPLDEAVLGGAALVLASSPLVVTMAYTAGFFDRFLELATLGAVVALARRRLAPIPILVCAGVLVHELFLVYGLPVLLFAVLVSCARPGEPVDRRELVRGLALVLVPAGLAVGAIAVGQYLLTDTDLGRIEEDILRYGLLERKGAGYATFHLRHDLADNYGLQASKVLGRFLRGDIAQTVLPPLALLLATSSLLLVRLGRAVLILPLLLVAGAPLLLHFVAWDTARFSTFTLFHAFAALLAVVLVHGDRLAEAAPGRWGRRVGWGLAACALPVVAGNVLLEVPGFPAERVTDEAFLRWRTSPTPHSFEDCRPLFENAGFESGNLDGWTTTGEAFAQTPERAVPPRGNLPHQGVLGSWWVSSYRRDRTGDDSPLRHRARGSLESVPFRIEGDDILLAVGGGQNRARLYVALEVEGREVFRETGSGSEILESRAWDVRPYRSREAVIRIVDASDRRMGFIHADGFCTFR